MKKIFYFIASAIVALGAVACQNDIEEGINNGQQTEGVSIKVTIAEQSRVALGEVEAEGRRKLSFTEGDVLVVRSDWQSGDNYLFTYTKKEGDAYTFTCADEGVSSLVGTKPNIFYLGGLREQADVDAITISGAVCRTEAEDISGIGMYSNPTMQSGNLGEEGYTVTLGAQPLLKFTANEPVTFKSESYLFFVDGRLVDEYTTKKTGEIYLPVLPSNGIKITMTVTTESGFNKSFESKLDENKIYDLGTIEKPAPQTYKVYVIAQPKSAQATWTTVNLYTWEDGTENKTAAWPGNNITSQKETINDYTYNYYEYPATWNGKNIKVIINNGSAQTSDIPVGVLDKNYYVVYNDEGTVYTEAPAAGSIKEVEATLSEWALAGDFNSWGDKVMEVVAGANNLFVAKNVNISAYTEIKVKKVGDWNTSYGGGITYLNANKWMKLYSGGSNIAIVTAGTYDVYFDKANTKLYLMKSGVDYNTAAEQSANGPAPDTSKYTWGVVGNHNGWGNDNVLAWDGTLGLYVAKGVKLNGEFKVRADKVWTTSFGSGGTVTVNNAKATTVYNNGGNCKLSSYSGTYDIYFWYDTTNIKANGKIWVYTAGNAAPTL